MVVVKIKNHFTYSHYLPGATSGASIKQKKKYNFQEGMNQNSVRNPTIHYENIWEKPMMSI